MTDGVAKVCYPIFFLVRTYATTLWIGATTGGLPLQIRAIWIFCVSPVSFEF